MARHLAKGTAEDVTADLLGRLDQRAEQLAVRGRVRTERVSRLVDGPVDHARPAAVERVGERQLRVAEHHPAAGQVERAEERTTDGERVGGRADVVRKPGQRERGGPAAAAHGVRGLVQADRESSRRHGDGGGETVGSGAHDHDVVRALGHRVAP